MNPLRRRIETLEQDTQILEATLIVVGEPTPDQVKAIERGLIGTLILIPENFRDRERGASPPGSPFERRD